MKKAAIAALAIVAAGAAAALSHFTGHPVAAAKPQPAAAGIPITAGTVAVADVPVLLDAIGTVQAYNMVSIKSRVDGNIMRVAFTEGQEVTAGTPLVEIDPRSYQAALADAQAQKEKDQAQLASAEADLARSAALLAPGYRTRQTYDQQKAMVEQLKAALKSDEARINTAQLNLGYTDIRAPIDGRLGARLVDPGNLVRATDNAPLVTIAQIKPIFVSFTIAQDNLDQIREQQQKAPLVVRAYSSDGQRQLGEGSLSLIDNAIDQATGTVRLKATFENRRERLWPGEFVKVRLVLSVRRGVATVPEQTVQAGPEGHYAYVIKPDNTVERRTVEVAAVQDGIAVVTKGLAPGEQVVVDGQYRLVNGARVVPAAPAAGRAG